MFFTDRAFLIRLFPQAAQLRLIEFCLCALVHFSLAGSQFFLPPWETTKYLKRSGTEPRTSCFEAIRSNHWTMTPQAYRPQGSCLPSKRSSVRIDFLPNIESLIFLSVIDEYSTCQRPLIFSPMSTFPLDQNYFRCCDLFQRSQDHLLKLRRDSNLGLSHRA